MFWEERTQRRAGANLNVVLTDLRQRAGPYIEITRETVGLNPASDIWVDMTTFEQNLDAGQIEAALDLYQGDFLAGFTVDSAPFELWATRERERLRLAAMDALDRQIARLLDQGDYREGITAATRLLHMDPLREETYRQMMHLLAHSGQRTKALEQYDVLCRMLDEELSVAPMVETTALYERIRYGQFVHERATEITRGEDLPISTPHPRHDLPIQATSFVGREAEITAISEQLLAPNCRLLTLVGRAVWAKHVWHWKRRSVS